MILVWVLVSMVAVSVIVGLLIMVTAFIWGARHLQDQS